MSMNTFTTYIIPLLVGFGVSRTFTTFRPNWSMWKHFIVVWPIAGVLSVILGILVRYFHGP